MHILGIETATRTGGIAILTEKGVVAEYTLNIEVTHSERLMSTVDRVLRDTGIALAAIDGFAVSIGPGSFTGLRIGISTAKGLAFTTEKPVMAVPTLKALAWNLPDAAIPICPLLDARKKEVYAAVYRLQQGVIDTVMGESVLPIQALQKKTAGQMLFTGEGALLFRKELRDVFGGRALFAPLAALVPSAASVAEIGLGMLQSGATTDPDMLTPLYIRRPEAEIAWEKRQQSR
jgi:tRNA threonylcarbamoyladenosine biosynthesis protein TsaB